MIGSSVACSCAAEVRQQRCNLGMLVPFHFDLVPSRDARIGAAALLVGISSRNMIGATMDIFDSLKKCKRNWMQEVDWLTVAILTFLYIFLCIKAAFERGSAFNERDEKVDFSWRWFRHTSKRVIEVVSC